MYRAHYDLQVKPFQLSSDANFIWLGEKHRETLAAIKSSVFDNKGLQVLTGDVGTGKTTLINSLIVGLGAEVSVVLVRDPGLDQLLFLNFIATSFGIGGGFFRREKFLSCFSRFLLRAHQKNKKVLLVIDECQLLSHELLREIYYLLNIITRDGKPLLNILLVGQCDFQVLLSRPENQAIVRKLTLSHSIEPLTLEESGEYIRHRLTIAGAENKIFKASAVKAIYNFSGGFPRRINILCDHCLMNGFVEGKQKIGKSLVKVSFKALQIPKRRFRRHQMRAINQAAKAHLFRPAAGYVLAFLVVLSFYLLFSTHSGTTFTKDNVASIASQQGETALKVAEVLEDDSSPGSQGENGLAKRKKEPSPLPGSSELLPVIITDSSPEMGRDNQAAVVQGDEDVHLSENQDGKRGDITN